MSYSSVLQKGLLQLPTESLIMEPSSPMMPPAPPSSPEKTPNRKQSREMKELNLSRDQNETIEATQLMHWCNLKSKIEILEVSENQDVIHEICNDMFVDVNKKKNKPFVLSLASMRNHLSNSGQLNGILSCKKHTPEAIWFEQREYMLLYNLVQEFPIGIHQELIDFHHGENAAYNFPRSFRMTFNVDPYNPDVVHATPCLTSEILFGCTTLANFAEDQYLLLTQHKINHLYCIYCFPTVYGIVCHALEMKYEPCFKNVPHGMLCGVIQHEQKANSEIFQAIYTFMSLPGKSPRQKYNYLVDLVKPCKTENMDHILKLDYIREFHLGLIMGHKFEKYLY